MWFRLWIFMFKLFQSSDLKWKKIIAMLMDTVYFLLLLPQNFWSRRVWEIHLAELHYMEQQFLRKISERQRAFLECGYAKKTYRRGPNRSCQFWQTFKFVTRDESNWRSGLLWNFMHCLERGFIYWNGETKDET